MANRDIQKIKNQINKNKRRALGTLTPEEVLFFLDYFGDNCAYSGTSLDKLV